MARHREIGVLEYEVSRMQFYGSHRHPVNCPFIVVHDNSLVICVISYASSRSWINPQAIPTMSATHRVLRKADLPFVRVADFTCTL